jgi:hypothetical protein
MFQAQDVQAERILFVPLYSGFYTAPLQQRWDFPRVSQVHKSGRSQVHLPEELEDIVICTNINLNEANLIAYGIELVTSHENLSDKILNFEQLPSGKTPLCYTN